MGKKVLNLSQHLNYSVELGAIDSEKKKVSFILSDETIVGRGWYDLQLLHEKKNINFDRKKILKVFYNHKSQDLPIGKWENLRLEDGKLKADALFDTNDEFAMKSFSKIEGGYLESISVGISIITHTREQREKQNDLIIATKWEIFEASIVNIPAIPNAKVGLEFEQEEKPNKEQKSMDLETFKKEHPELFTKVFNLGVTAESNRVEAIDKILKPELAQHFTAMKYDGTSTAEQIELAQFRKEAELREADEENLKTLKKSVDVDGVNLGQQVLDMNLAGDGDATKEAEKLAKEKKEDAEDGDAFFSGVAGAKRDE